jgi:hypothetical protein
MLSAVSLRAISFDEVSKQHHPLPSKANSYSGQLNHFQIVNVYSADTLRECEGELSVTSGLVCPGNT